MPSGGRGNTPSGILTVRPQEPVNRITTATRRHPHPRSPGPGYISRQLEGSETDLRALCTPCLTLGVNHQETNYGFCFRGKTEIVWMIQLEVCECKFAFLQRAEITSQPSGEKGIRFKEISDFT